MSALLLSAILMQTSSLEDIWLPRDLTTPSLGASVSPLSDETEWMKAEGIPLPDLRGVVAAVDAFGPLGDAGCRKVTVISKISGRSIRDAESFNEAVLSLSLQEDAEIQGYSLAQDRNGDPSWLPATWHVRPARFRETVMESLVRTRDDANGITTYRHNSSPAKYTEGDGVFVYLMKRDSGTVILRCRYQHPIPDVKTRPRYWKAVGFGLVGAMLNEPVVANSPESIHLIDGREWIDDVADERVRKKFSKLLSAEAPHAGVLLQHRDNPEGRSQWVDEKVHVNPVQLHAIRTALQAYAIMVREQERSERK